jgi:hypothetical protein
MFKLKSILFYKINIDKLNDDRNIKLLHRFTFQMPIKNDIKR